MLSSTIVCYHKLESVHQLLPHICNSPPTFVLFPVDLRVSANYTCSATNTEGTDILTHVIHVTSEPSPPFIVINKATYDSINVSIATTNDGGAPLLGET